jgi:hypothetical protein
LDDVVQMQKAVYAKIRMEDGREAMGEGCNGERAAPLEGM